MPDNPFDSVDSAYQYIELLREQVDETRSGIMEDLAQADVDGAVRRAEALRLVEYKLDLLQHHLIAARRILGDLRTLRRLLLGERERQPPSSSAYEPDIAGA